MLPTAKMESEKDFLFSSLNTNLKSSFFGYISCDLTIGSCLMKCGKNYTTNIIFICYEGWKFGKTQFSAIKYLPSEI